jgi:glycosyltransferase involved in cell wall biosynthesis
MVKNILTDWEKVDASKIRLIPHGFRLEEFENVDPSRVEAIKKKYDLLLNEPVIGVISRFTEWKGVQYIIPAFSKLLSRHPQAVLMLLNAHGDYKVRILELLKEIPAKNYRLVPFEKDIPAVYKSFEVFVHTPVDDHSEAFGQTYVEALAAGIPSVFTLSGIAPDFIIDGQNALVVPHKDQAAIGQAIEKIIDDPALSAALRANGPASVRGSFELKKMISRLESLYDE